MTTTDATDTAAASGVRRRLTPDERREIARLYGEADASTADIRTKFGISDPTLYRVLQKQGIPLRRRGGAQPAPASTANGHAPAEAAPRAAVTRTRRTVARGEAVSAASADAATQFRIEFRGERVFDAADIEDALRQAKALGVVDILAITREG